MIKGWLAPTSAGLDKLVGEILRKVLSDLPDADAMHRIAKTRDVRHAMRLSQVTSIGCVFEFLRSYISLAYWMSGRHTEAVPPVIRRSLDGPANSVTVDAHLHFVGSGHLL